MDISAQKCEDRSEDVRQDCLSRTSEGRHDKDVQSAQGNDGLILQELNQTRNVTDGQNDVGALQQSIANLEIADYSSGEQKSPESTGVSKKSVNTCPLCGSQISPTDRCELPTYVDVEVPVNLALKIPLKLSVEVPVDVEALPQEFQFLESTARLSGDERLTSSKTASPLPLKENPLNPKGGDV